MCGFIQQQQLVAFTRIVLRTNDRRGLPLTLLVSPQTENERCSTARERKKGKENTENEGRHTHFVICFTVELNGPLFLSKETNERTKNKKKFFQVSKPK